MQDHPGQQSMVNFPSLGSGNFPNMNPALNAPTPATANNGMGAVGGRFDAFADQNPFTMKMLDAYVFSSLL